MYALINFYLFNSTGLKNIQLHYSAQGFNEIVIFMQLKAIENGNKYVIVRKLLSIGSNSFNLCSNYMQMAQYRNCVCVAK